mmetsp:Transcript_3769/g.5041  ORF Transcript_3769/g.5041 Transcript_3769/m.5041 type:complete len:84 (+) Transcript_3769:339-590(+)
MNVDKTGLFAGEQPAPITVNNNNGPSSKGKRRSQSRDKKQRSLSAKKQKPAANQGGRRLNSAYGPGKTTYDQKQTNKYKKSID